MRQGTRFVIVAVLLGLLYWPVSLWIPKPILGEFLSDIRAVTTILAGLMFIPLLWVAIQAPEFRRQQAFVVAMCVNWIAIGGISMYSLLARQFDWPMTTATSNVIQFLVYVSFLAATLHITSLVARGARYWIMGAIIVGAVAATIAYFF